MAVLRRRYSVGYVIPVANLRHPALAGRVPELALHAVYTLAWETLERLS